MIYLTTVNFARFIKSLELDIPNFYRKSFYWGSKLTHFSVDLGPNPKFCVNTHSNLTVLV